MPNSYIWSHQMLLQCTGSHLGPINRTDCLVLAFALALCMNDNQTNCELSDDDSST